MPTNTINGKAFEYACLKSIKALVPDAIIKDDKPYQTAKNAYKSIENDERVRLDEAAETATRLLNGLEPKLVHGAGSLELSIAADAIAIGTDGDVRDVFCMRRDDGSDGWTIGASCKHNHEALRHPRITEGKDFGKDWLGISCSQEFMDAVTPIVDSLVEFGEQRVQWNTIPDKLDSYYVPILQAYVDEITRLCDENDQVPNLLLSYFFGSNDFYKIIMHSSSRTTTVEGFNMHGTLNKPAGSKRAITRIPTMNMPTRLFNADFKQDRDGPSKTTIILTFDNGWAISMRLHNKDRIAKPTSLAWDVKLVGLPPSAYVNTHSWDE